MKSRLLVIAALAGAAILTLGSTQAAADPDSNHGASGVTSPLMLSLIGSDDLFATTNLVALLDPTGVNHTQHYGPYTSGSPDSGTCGNDWATDTFDRHFTVHSNHDGTYTVVQQFKNGSFVTNEGPSPGSCDLTDGSPPGTVDQGVTGIEVKTTDRWQAAGIASRLVGALGWPYRTVDWQEQNHSLFQALKLEKLGMGVILLLIVLVAAFNIVSNLTMVVADKTREIGILKAMGMTSASVRRVFFAQGLVIGLVGTLLGVLLGIAASLALGKYQFIKLNPEIYFIDHLPVATEAMDIVLTILASVVIAAVATLYPSMQAARLYPIEAIRHE